MLKFHFLRCEVEEQIGGVQPTHQNRPDLTQFVGLGQFLGLSGLGWVTIFLFFLYLFFYSGSGCVGSSSGHKILNLPNPTRPTHIFNIYLKYIIYLIIFFKTSYI